MVRRISHTALRGLLPFVVLLAAAACNLRRGPLEGRASDEWTRTYTLDEGGEIQIVGGTGTIDVQTGTGHGIEVRAERIVRARTDAAAKPLVSRVRISEDVTPAKIVLRDEGLGGIILGIEVEVNFHLTVPPATRLRLHSANGDITVRDVTGPLVLSSTNGEITGTALGGSVEARSTNGPITIDLAALTRDRIDLRATNGQIALTLPADSNANIAATCSNGSIDMGDLPVELTGEQTKRRVRARLNQGGTSIELTTTNGDIHIRPRR
jgi:hypothetical protein